MEAAGLSHGSGFGTPTAEATGFEPARIVEVDIGRPLPELSAVDPRTGRVYRRALALVRLHTRPLGWVNLRLGAQGLNADELARQIWRVLSAEVDEHLRRDDDLSNEGLGRSGRAGTPTDMPPCLVSRQQVLTDAPLVSVVLATRERPQLADRCVRSLLSLAYPPSRYEIIVVDNAPQTSATADLIKRGHSANSRVQYVREDRPGLSNARNRGLALAQGDVVAFVDDDEIVDEHLLTELVGGFSVSEQVACVTGLIAPLEMETPEQGWFEQFGGYCKGACARHIFTLTDHRPKSALFPYTVGMFGSGGNMAFKRSILRDLGGFDPALGLGTPTLGGEDIEVLLRVVLAGHTLVYEPAAIVHHPSHRDYARLRRQIYGYGAGLSACFFRTLLARPRLLPDFIAKVPSALAFTFSPQSAHHANKQPNYPRELTWLERKGMLYGPLAYLRSRRQFGQCTRGGLLSEDVGIEAVIVGEAG